MLKLLKLFFWLVLVLVVLGGLDQFLVRVPLELPGLSHTQTFYVDFRSRLLALAGVESSTTQVSIEQVIEKTSTIPQQMQQAKRYLYADDAGILQFVDTLEQVPVKYRKDAQPLAE